MNASCSLYVEQVWKDFQNLYMKREPGKIKILAVDDSPGNIIALEAVFSGTSYQIVAAHSGKQALEILQKDPDVTLILLDVQMPVMDGFQTAEEIKKIDGLNDIPIIFISAVYNEDPCLKKGFRAGAIDYFSKPFDPEILKLKVDMYSSYRQKMGLLKERERRIYETEELLKAGRKFSEILESLTVGVMIADKEGKIIQTNDVVSRILKTNELQKKDAYGKIISWWEGNGLHLKDVGGPIRLALDHGVPTHNKYLDILAIDKSIIHVVVSSSPLHSENGEVAGVVIVFQDVSESKKLEEDFEEKLSNLISLGLKFEHSANQ